MSQFSYSAYQETVAKAKAGTVSSSVKVGFFKLRNDQDEALVRINVSSLDELQFATVHQLGAAQKWMKISCLNEVGSYSDNCPLCKRVAEGDTAIGKASKRVYVQMLVSYKDAATGGYTPAVPVIWERPAGFSRDLATLLKDYGSLREHVFKVTRNGGAGDMKTTYPISYIPMYDKPEAVPTDFSAFNNFNIAKHSYWEKTLEEIETFLATGSFPEVEARPAQESKNLEKVIPTKEEDQKIEEALGFKPETGPVVTPPVETPKTEEKPAGTQKFTGFTF